MKKNAQSTKKLNLNKESLRKLDEVRGGIFYQYPSVAMTDCSDCPACPH